MPTAKCVSSAHQCAVLALSLGQQNLTLPECNTRTDLSVMLTRTCTFTHTHTHRQQARSESSRTVAMRVQRHRQPKGHAPSCKTLHSCRWEVGVWHEEKKGEALRLQVASACVYEGVCAVSLNLSYFHERRPGRGSEERRPGTSSGTDAAAGGGRVFESMLTTHHSVIQLRRQMCLCAFDERK